MQRNNVQLHSEDVISKPRPGNLQVKPLGFLAKSLLSTDRKGARCKLEPISEKNLKHMF